MKICRGRSQLVLALSAGMRASLQAPLCVPEIIINKHSYGAPIPDGNRLSQKSKRKRARQAN